MADLFFWPLHLGYRHAETMEEEVIEWVCASPDLDFLNGADIDDGWRHLFNQPGKIWESTDCRNWFCHRLLWSHNGNE